MKIIKGLSVFILSGFMLLATAVHAQENNEIEVGYLRKTGHIDVEGFTLSKETTVKIEGHAGLYERMGNDLMFYGWILDGQTVSKVVWEITYRNTERAGGTSKNKLFDGTIILPAGEYTVYFETDGSHSYRDWNAETPHDQEHYGISVYLVK